MLTFQKFRDSVIQTQGFEELPSGVRSRIVNLVVGHWRFGDDAVVTVEEVAASFGKRMSFSERKYAGRTIETIQSVLRVDPSAQRDIWDFSEIAHDIEEQRDVEKNRNRRTYRIVDGPQELPGFPESYSA
jgi:hypothetical protein